MVLYLLFFFICYFIDTIPPKQKSIQYILVVLLFAFLCFGYMTGSDWRYYELAYNGETFTSRFEAGEWGFLIILNIFSYFIDDYWLFTGILKVFFLLSLLKMMSIFTKNNYSALAFAFGGSLLFIIIDCPLRFMVALTFIQIGAFLWFKGYKVWALVLMAPSIVIHATTIIVILFLLSYPLSKFFNRIPISAIFASYVIILIVSAIQSSYSYLYSSIIPMFFADSYENYTEYNNEAILTVGTLKNTFLFLMVLLNKKLFFRGNERGKYVYYYTCLYFLIRPLLMAIPTGFRLAILLSFFSAIAYAIILFSYSNSMLLRKVVISMFAFLLAIDVNNSISYSPYSNSIIHILTGNHYPFSYRDSYNEKNHNTINLF